MKHWKILIAIVLVVAAGILLWNNRPNVDYEIDQQITADPSDCRGDLRFAVIGDFGDTGPFEADVAALIDSWEIEGSQVRYNRNYGAQLVTVDETCINFSFYSRAAELIDSHRLRK